MGSLTKSLEIYNDSAKENILPRSFLMITVDHYYISVMICTELSTPKLPEAFSRKSIICVFKFFC